LMLMKDFIFTSYVVSLFFLLCLISGFEDYMDHC
jgi:hypothetical protein